MALKIADSCIERTANGYFWRIWRNTRSGCGFVVVAEGTATTSDAAIAEMCAAAIANKVAIRS